MVTDAWSGLVMLVLEAWQVYTEFKSSLVNLDTSNSLCLTSEKGLKSLSSARVSPRHHLTEGVGRPEIKHIKNSKFGVILEACYLGQSSGILKDWENEDLQLGRTWNLDLGTYVIPYLIGKIIKWAFI